MHSLETKPRLKRDAQRRRVISVWKSRVSLKKRREIAIKKMTEMNPPSAIGLVKAVDSDAETDLFPLLIRSAAGRRLLSRAT